ncbi:hypothetical protein LWI28_022865 [Acer negundo]|uniref:Uncharacterized protein n=1 Tax=Acer negundo TaxID=4023 RepID=A0AAD5J725_ACENE|nr:hypothetical protein LWI28_022865 [Acer negundo]
MGTYEVEIQGDKFKASVIDNAAVLDAKINEFWSSLVQHTRPPVDVKVTFDECKARKLELLVLSDLAKEVGLDYVETASTSNGTSTDWNAIAFTDEEIMCAIQESLYVLCYGIGNKVLTMVA